MKTHNGKPLVVTSDYEDNGYPAFHNIALQMREKCDAFWVKRGMEPKLKPRPFGRKTESKEQ